MTSHIYGHRDGSVAERLNLPTIRGLPVLVPPLDEQRAIAHILGTLDDKIDLNRRMNETLEAMARAIFKSWFVDFDPVRAKAEGRDPALPKHVADLFPDRFKDSELGEIPAGWRVKQLGDVADVNWGDTNTTKASYSETGYPAYSASGKDGYLPYHDFDRKGVVVSAIGANAGLSWLVLGKWSCIKNTLRFWSTELDVSTEYLFHATHGRDKWPLRGSAQPFIAQGDARALRMLIPSNGLAETFGTIVGVSMRRLRPTNRNPVPSLPYETGYCPISSPGISESIGVSQIGTSHE
jgi:type I restriction enzyme S subunit